VPWYLRAGKCLPTTAAEVLVRLKAPPQRLFDDSPLDASGANHVRFKLQPSSAVALAARIKRPGKGFVGEQRELYLCEDFSGEEQTYERLLGDAMAGDGSLFTSQDAVEAAWAVGRPRPRRPCAVPAVRARDVGPGGRRRADRRRRRLARPGPEARRARVPAVTHAAMTAPIVFLLDVDNTLLDNDRIIADLREHLEREFGVASSDRYWAPSKRCAASSAMPTTSARLQRYRADVEADDAAAYRLLSLSTFLIDYPFAERLYPGALDVVARSAGSADGHPVRRRRRLPAAQGAALGPLGRGRGTRPDLRPQGRMLDAVQRCYPARRYAMVDDKQRVLTAMKEILGARLVTVFPRQGHYAHDPANIARYPAADISSRRIGDLLELDLASRLGPPGDLMNANTRKLQALGQSLWLDNITRQMLDDGTLARYIASSRSPA
jgi:hypothetical protein